MKEKYLNPKLDIETRVEDLLSRMTIDEKIDQMYTTGVNVISELCEKIDSGEKVDISCTFVYHEFDVEEYNKLQKHQVENSRLHIPFILACENTHGVSHPLCTIFPTTGCVAATFDESYAYKMAEASGKEARILGINQVYAPNIDISWDLRWGRIEENYGEDPYLTSRMGVGYCKGMQGQGVSATIKHYIAYGLGESGLNLAPAHIGEREVREYMLPPFEACVKEGNAWSIMPSYNEVDGEPTHASKLWNKTVLREELGFDGMSITDYGASNMLYGFHRIIDSPVQAGEIICANEIDMEGCSYFGYNDEFRAKVKNGEYPIANVDKCVKNILRLKFRLGLFENPYAEIEKLSEIHNEKHVALAREIAEKGIVLLKNDGLLPLESKKKVALIGPNANIAQLGNYIYYGYFNENYKGKCVAEEALSLKEVLENSGVDFEFAQGSIFEQTNDQMLNEALEVASRSDVVILALGDNSKGGKNAGNQEKVSEDDRSEVAVTSGEGYDLNSIELTVPQKALFDKVAESGKPIILVMYGGRPHAITEQVDRCSAIIHGFGVGEEGNKALWDIITGKVNPSGKLPISYPRSTGHLPCFYNFKPSAKGALYQQPGTYDMPGRDYVFDNPNALYPFGHGLSYTTFEYSDLKVEKVGDLDFKASVTVKNTGDRAGEESVLVFLSALAQRITPMVKKLRAFKRVSLKPGESTTVQFNLGKDDFTYVGVEMKKEIAYGRYIISVDKLQEEFRV